MNPDVTISIICTDNRAMLRDCLESLSQTIRQVTAEVIVVDNASTDGTAEMLQCEYPQVTVIHNRTRLGFSSNNNQVLYQACGRYVMLLNDDIVVLPGALDLMVAFMDGHPEVAATGGMLLNPDGSRQLCFFTFPHPVLEAFHPLTDRWRLIWPSSDDPIEVDWVSGATLMVRRSVLHRTGLLDPAFDPIYSEETDWCYRIRERGGRIYGLPGARFIHFGGATMNRAPVRKVELLYQKRALYFLKHGGRAAKEIFKVSLWLASMGKLVIWSGLLPFSKQRARDEIPIHRHMMAKAFRL